MYIRSITYTNVPAGSPLDCQLEKLAVEAWRSGLNWPLGGPHSLSMWGVGGTIILALDGPDEDILAVLFEDSVWLIKFADDVVRIKRYEVEGLDFVDLFSTGIQPAHNLAFMRSL